MTLNISDDLAERHVEDEEPDSFRAEGHLRVAE